MSASIKWIGSDGKVVEWTKEDRITYGTPEVKAQAEAEAERERRIIKAYILTHIDEVIDLAVDELSWTPEDIAEMQRQLAEYREALQ